ncbi:Outer membrane protein assembly factor BamD [Pseudomonas saudimassiliensis]|uniref:Outer membrane protein assembly factor BamD n=1 Tax=Pseudomonas saudimassiliensis TaxID=1461581 RepID=A0A078M3K0_9PSED|nr:outer membrane protein assembly factor BamD [Pseudomonas saudimassiliensis]CEA02128.1 Outer membrane protein assembly factor BamD [Pseudomonas saudimassiliensis]CEF25740.1 Outer membrane protein assembly factor BamD [Pseudomonas saudimassiliensis]
MRLLAVLWLSVGLVGCASTGSPQRSEEGLIDARAKISMGRCDTKLVADLRKHPVPELDQQAAYVCLQQGEVKAVEALLEDYQQRHVEPPHPDYSAYLLTLAQYARFEMAAEDDVLRLKEGRKLHAQFADFVRRFPDSDYRTEIAPRLHELLEGMAAAEYRLALTAAEAGDREGGRQRMDYVARYYPHTESGREARAWLERLQEE